MEKRNIEPIEAEFKNCIYETKNELIKFLSNNILLITCLSFFTSIVSYYFIEYYFYQFYLYEKVLIFACTLFVAFFGINLIFNHKINKKFNYLNINYLLFYLIIIVLISFSIWSLNERIKEVKNFEKPKIENQNIYSRRRTKLLERFYL